MILTKNKHKKKAIRWGTLRKEGAPKALYLK